jgi:hypothetical protein
VLRAAGRPFPELTDDDVMNYLITEAVYLKVNHEDREAQKEAEEQAKRDQWKEEAKESLERFR